MAFLFVIAYGAGNGILTIVRGAAPAEMYGTHGLGGLLGYLSRASSYARALGPATYPALIALGLGEATSLGLLDTLEHHAGGAAKIQASLQQAQKMRAYWVEARCTLLLARVDIADRRNA